MTERGTDRVIVYDVTLRDGEQSPGISLDVAEKVEIAEQLARLGVDYIEAGFPVASQGDFDAVQAVARQVRGPGVSALCRTHRGDIDRAWEAIHEAERARIHTFIATSPSHMARKLGMAPEQVRAEAAGGVAHARQYTDDVEFSAEDATRSDPEFLVALLRDVVAAGATTINIPDTVGYTTPWEYAELIRHIRAEVPGDYVLSTHCHDDLGMAVANSLAAITGGARQVECTVNGIGERAGNAALEEIVMAIATRADQLGVTTGVVTTELARASRLVSRLSGYPVQYNKAVVGRNAFAHESGIHQHGVLADRSTYEIMDPVEVGQVGTSIVLGKHSGRHAFADALGKLGFNVAGPVLEAAFERFKDLADRKVQLTDADLEAIVSEELGGGTAQEYVLAWFDVRGGTAGIPRATVAVADSSTGEKREATSEGDGMIDAACKAINQVTGIEGRLVDFTVSSVTGGVDALADVVVQLQVGDIAVSGRGVSTDVVEGAVRAYLNAVNRIVRVRGRAQPSD